MRERDNLTGRQQAVLEFISRSIAERGYPPTLREIGEHMGIRSTNGVNDHLKALEKKGYLVREDLKSRAIRPVRPLLAEIGGEPPRMSQELVDVPIVGRVAAGLPLLAVENVEDTVKIDRFFVGTNKEVFALRIKGDSMIEDGIHDGDFIFVRKSFAAERGDIVVALIGDEATVKRYYPEKDTIRFQPANASMQPIVVRRSEFKSVDLIGVVVGVYRRIR
ncbi:MAG: transcriptional repressor LexA [Pseudomonadota bacterium]